MREWMVPFDDRAAMTELWWWWFRSFEDDERDDRRPLIKFMVAQFGGLMVEIFSDEHGPPHFRVRCGEESANFRISDCAPLAGELSRHGRKIRRWHKGNKQKLIDTWNERRPTNCPVGNYVEP